MSPPPTRTSFSGLLSIPFCGQNLHFACWKCLAFEAVARAWLLDLLLRPDFDLLQMDTKNETLLRTTERPFS